MEEWRKMAADYKNSSITLGKFEVANSQQQWSRLHKIGLEFSRFVVEALFEFGRILQRDCSKLEKNKELYS